MDLQDRTEAGQDRFLRDYLLGLLRDEAAKEQIETRLLTDDGYFDEFGIAEDGLIEEYVENELTTDEREAFERHFLVSQERREKLKFAEAFQKRLVGSGASPGAETPRATFRAMLASYFTPVPLAVGALTVVVIGIVLWTVYRGNDNGEAMVALNKAYRAERPVEARVSALEYAPFYKVRNNREPVIDLNERERAEIMIRDRVSESSDASTHHALGRLLLLKKQFDDAIKELEIAERLNPGSAEIQNDLGVALLEKSKAERSDHNSANARLPRLALDRFDKAIRADPAKLEAYFNRAETLEILDLPNEAKAAWQKYLELDSSSRWAQEARDRLQQLTSTSLAPELSGAELEQAFHDAFRRRSDSEMFDLASRNRELIRQKYLPVRFAWSFTEAAPAARTESLDALTHLGLLESERIGDKFAADLADYYRGVPETDIDILRQAHASMHEGYKHCLKEEFAAANQQFNSARKLFLRAGNVVEADTVAKYFIAYSLYYDDRAASAALLTEIAELCERRSFRWFGLMNHYWWLGSQESLGHRSFTRTKLDYRMALGQAEAMHDFYMTQKFLLSLVMKADFVRDRNESALYVQKLLSFSKSPGLSTRQKLRTVNGIVQVAAREGDTAFSKALVRENVALAKSLPDPSFLVAAELNAGVAYTRAGDWKEAEEWFEKAGASIEALPQDATGRDDMAEFYLNRGHLENARADLEGALSYYEKAIELADGRHLVMPVYEAQKARLLVLAKLGRDDQLAAQIQPTLELAENYRKTILDDQERNTFFNSEQDVYDVGIDLEWRRGQYENAYDLAELSNSRSLLDRLTEMSIAKNHEPVSGGTSAPVGLAELRAELPDDVQLVQYRILHDRLLIWVVSREHFFTASADIDANKLQETIEAYLRLVQSKSDEARVLSGELYKILIEPVAGHLDAKKFLCIIPNRILFYLPFASLSAESDQGFLVEKFSLLYAPSANVFLKCTRNGVGKSNALSENILSIGNPAFNREAFVNLHDLPESSAEAKLVAAVYGDSTVLLGRHATPQAFRSLYKDFDIIHFAGHYVTEPNAPGRSRLVMASTVGDSGIVTNGELMDERLSRARLVVLSACQTGVEGYYGGEGFVGLSRTFLAAGVPIVVASSWPVDSGSTSLLMQKFHGYRQSGNSTVRALQQAQIDMIHETSATYSQPYAWAGFGAFGGYTTF